MNWKHVAGGVVVLYVVAVVAGAVLPGMQSAPDRAGANPGTTTTTAATPTTTTTPEPTSRYHPDDPGLHNYSNMQFRYEEYNLSERKINYYLYRYINQLRENRGREKWEYSLRLSSMARAYSYQMDQADMLNHSVNGKTPWGRWDEMSNKCVGNGSVFAENIYYAPVTAYKTRTYKFNRNEVNKSIARDAVEDWLASPSHRALLLSEGEGYERIGVGVYIAPNLPRGEGNFAEVWVTIEVCGGEDPEKSDSPRFPVPDHWTVDEENTFGAD